MFWKYHSITLSSPNCPNMMPLTSNLAIDYIVPQSFFHTSFIRECCRTAMQSIIFFLSDWFSLHFKKLLTAVFGTERSQAIQNTNSSSISFDFDFSFVQEILYGNGFLFRCICQMVMLLLLLCVCAVELSFAQMCVEYKCSSVCVFCHREENSIWSHKFSFVFH